MPVTENSITIDFRAPAPVYRPELGIFPFHMGCNALGGAHPNCGLCHPELYHK